MKRIACILAAALLTFAAEDLRAQDSCVDASCLCTPSGANNGVYWARVDGGNQVSVFQVVRANPQGSDPDVIVVPGLAEPAGTEILYTDNGYLVVRGAQVGCPGSAPGGASVSRQDAIDLVTSPSCYSDVTAIVPGSCDTGPLTCSAAGPAAVVPAALLALGALLGQRRRRSSASISAA